MFLNKQEILYSLTKQKDNNSMKTHNIKWAQYGKEK